ncbi:MAG TPA: BON domain-containing protein [Actinomycetota bacterium]|nr:BON domain-containing protein [Actinomycetota bacterium]
MSKTAEEPQEYLLGRIQQALATDDRTGELELDVRIAGGRIFLTGTVATAERRDAVQVVVREVAPDLEVVNELSLPPAGAPGAEEDLPS